MDAGLILVTTWLKFGSILVYPVTLSNLEANNEMTQKAENLFANVSQSDPLEFWANHGLDYQKVSQFLEFDTNALSKLSGVSKKSVRLDNRIPRNLERRLEEIANICTLVAEYFDGDAAKTALWFRTINAMLGSVSPRDMIRLGRYKRLLKFVTDALAEAEAPGE